MVHGEAQLTGRWGEHGRQVVLDTSSVKVFLPGITDVSTVDAAAKLCGQASWKVRGQDHASRHDVATPDMIRQLPARLMRYCIGRGAALGPIGENFGRRVTRSTEPTRACQNTPRS